MLILAHAAPITLFILALFYKWFALDDRYAVFLYGHLNATPFDEITTSRYAMAGLVACGAVMLLYIAANFSLVLIVRGYRVPACSRVWLLCALPLAIGIVLITTTQNAPTLPLNLALGCAIAALAGLMFALIPGAVAAQNPRELAWLAFDGFGLMPMLIIVRAIEMADKGLFVGAPVLYAVAAGSIVGGAVWLIGMGLGRAWRRVGMPSARAILVAGICWSYLALPLAHYLFATPANFKYITASANFFATNVGLQTGIFLVALFLAIGATCLRTRLTLGGRPSAVAQALTGKDNAA